MKYKEHNLNTDDYQEFLKGELKFDDSAAKGEEKFTRLQEVVSADLVSSKFKLALIYFVFSSIGYILNLSLCAQGPVGLTQFSHKVFVFLHFHFHSCLCAFTCGTLFTSLPFAISFLCLTHFQRRFLLFHMAWFLALIPILATAAMFVSTFHSLPSTPAFVLFGQSIKMGWINGFVWTGSALLMPALLYLLFSTLNKQKEYKKPASVSLI